jgi:TRAP-type C4-dicarboxylate transport system substrate-binding protein
MKLTTALVGLALCSAATPALAQTVFKLGTVAPVASPVEAALKSVAAKWRQVSERKVELKVYAGGAMGGEPDIVKKLKNGQLEAAALTSVGLRDLVPDVLVLDLPHLTQSDAEWAHLIDKLGPRLAAALEAKGYRSLCWAKLGATQFFTTSPRGDLAALGAGKLFVWANDKPAADAWTAAGFKPVILPMVDLVPALADGRTDTVPSTWASAAVQGLASKARFATDLPWSSLSGALIVHKATWDALPADLRADLAKATTQSCGAVQPALARSETEARARLLSQGLRLTPVTRPPDWSKLTTDTRDTIRGKVIEASLYDEAYRIVAEYRAKNP